MAQVRVLQLADRRLDLAIQFGAARAPGAAGILLERRLVVVGEARLEVLERGLGARPVRRVVQQPRRLDTILLRAIDRMALLLQLVDLVGERREPIAERRPALVLIGIGHRERVLDALENVATVDERTDRLKIRGHAILSVAPSRVV
jgi:hypothetical protein